MSFVPYEKAVFLRANPQRLWAPAENKLSFLSHESLYRTGMCLLCCSILVKRLVTLSQLSTHGPNIYKDTKPKMSAFLNN